MRLMIVGDTHGHDDVVRRKARVAQSMGCSHMIIVGDFGMWPGHEGVVFLDNVNDAAREFNQKIIALPGNHDDEPQWEKWFDIAPIQDRTGFANIRTNLYLTKRMQGFVLGDKRFWVCGGAVSIDRDWRKPGKSWWPGETFNEELAKSVERYKGPPVDYLLSHDCSDFTPFRGRLKPDMESKANRQRLDRAIRALRPRMHFHGHMHTRYEWVNTESHGLRNTAWGYDESNYNGAQTATYGLEEDNERDSFVILDTGAQKDDPDKVYWPGEAYATLLGTGQE